MKITILVIQIRGKQRKYRERLLVLILHFKQRLDELISYLLILAVLRQYFPNLAHWKLVQTRLDILSPEITLEERPANRCEYGISLRFEDLL